MSAPTAVARRTLLIVFACSLAVKLCGVAYMNRYLSWNLVAPDSRVVYQPLAASLSAGNGYQLAAGARDATRVAPGFPLYLAALYRVFGVGVPVWWLGVLNAIMRSALTCFVYVLAFRAFGGMTAAFASAVHALDPWEAFWTAFVLKESLAVLLSIVAVHAIVRMLDAPTWKRGVWAGMVLGLAALTRYATLGLFLWTLVMLAWTVIRRRADMRSASKVAIALTLGLVATLSPWLVRNARLFGLPLVYTRAGFYFYVSNGPGTDRAIDTWGYSGRSSVDDEQTATIARNHPGLVERDAAFFHEALVYMISHPATAARMIGARFFNMWRPTFEGSSLANELILGVPYCAMMIASLIGMAIGWRGGAAEAQSARLALYWAVGFYVVLHVAFWSEIRYRQYVMPLLAVFAGFAISHAWNRFFDGEVRR